MTHNTTSAEEIRAAIETRIRDLEEELTYWVGELERIAARNLDPERGPDAPGESEHDGRAPRAPGRQGARSATGG